MRLVRNEEEVQRGLMEAVQEWNAENCLMKRFDGLAVEVRSERGTSRARTTVHSALRLA